ncbi:hypothetical protein GGS21DRAFT_198592 [Xylaria nigripes]|nr:hypothetical protein GGS21DRAFT_198592 [Xylaria nigripes]
MRADAFMKIIIMSFSTAIPRTACLPLSQSAVLSGRLESSSCDFYGYMDGEGIYNDYTVEMAGWGNDGSQSGCAVGIPDFIQSQCMTAVENFSCTQLFEQPHDTRLGFRLDKTITAQPDCVTEALKIASRLDDHEQTIQCFCLAECWTSETNLGPLE